MGLFFSILIVVISNTGDYIGKSRKNHIPRVGDFNEVGIKSTASPFTILLKHDCFNFQ